MSFEHLEKSIHHECLLAQNSSPAYHSDGSRLQNQVDEAEVYPVTRARLKRYVGPLNLQSVYIGELVGITLALDLALDKTNSYSTTPIMILADN